MTLLAQLRSTCWTIGIIVSVSMILIGVVLILHVWKGVPIGTLTRDPAAIVGVPFYTGFLSQTGLLFWSAAAAVCMFSASLLSKQPRTIELARFLLVSGLLTMMLGVDDVFLLHENVFPRYGVPEKVVMAAYVGLVLAYLVGFRTAILNTEYILLGMALGFFGISAVLDVADPASELVLFEDGAKLVGVVSWLAYFFRVGVSAARQRDPVVSPPP